MGAYAGVPHERYIYSAFGQVTQLGPAFTAQTAIYTDRFFTGQILDKETGLILYRNRVYHPTLGRFLQRDPIGYEAGNNVYRYIWNTPTDITDPYGNDGGEWPSWISGDITVSDLDKMIKTEKDSKRLRELQKAKKIKEQMQKRIKEKIKGANRRGTVGKKVLGCIFLIECETVCAATYNNCLDTMVNNYENCLKGAYQLNIKLVDNQISLCDRIYNLDLTACGVTYVACGLACLVPFDFVTKEKNSPIN
jgi:RHS repeat-associated protein